VQVSALTPEIRYQRSEIGSQQKKCSVFRFQCSARKEKTDDGASEIELQGHFTGQAGRKENASRRERREKTTEDRDAALGWRRASLNHKGKRDERKKVSCLVSGNGS
jgi:hypothetical protein